jgi:two-component system, OmpR family, phosphate regulon response regulator OmpR
MSQQDTKPQVMVVDDDLSVRDYLRAFLASRGFRPVTPHNAASALKLYHAERPAAVILEVFMPEEVDGLSALAAFKKIDH